MSWIWLRLHPSSKFTRDVTHYFAPWPEELELPAGFRDYGTVDMYKLDKDTAFGRWLGTFIPQDNWERDGYPPEEAEMSVGQDWYTDEVGEKIVEKGGTLFTGECPHRPSGVIDLWFDC